MTQPSQHPAKTVLNTLLNRYESSTAFVRGEPTTRRIQLTMNDQVIPGYISGGMDPDARRLLHETLLQWRAEGVVDIEWARFEQGNLLHRVLLQWDGITAAYKLALRTPKGDIIQAVESELASYEHTLTLPWMEHWLTDVRTHLKVKRSIPDSLLPSDSTRRRLLLEALAGVVAKADEVLPMRVFSKRYLKNSKAFEQEVRTRFTTLLRQYGTAGHATLREAAQLSDSDAVILSEFGIESTHQEIALCGPMVFQPSDAEASLIDCGLFPRGLALDTDALIDMEIVSLPVDTVLTIENKANFRHYVRHDFTGRELVIYLGGFPSPSMRQFLRKVWHWVQKSGGCNYVSLSHWGDLDYGGILIAQVLRDTVSEQFNAWRMEPEWLHTMAEYVEPFDDSYRTKLHGLLDDTRYAEWWPLVRELLAVGGTLEQEAFLV